jgi:hypothetical protein
VGLVKPYYGGIIMGHVLHIAITTANNPKEACGRVENEIEDFGDENNWRTIEGCFCQDGTKYVTKDADHGFIDKYASLDGLESDIKNWITIPDDVKKNALQSLKQVVKYLSGKCATVDLCEAKGFIDRLYASRNCPPDFDMWNDEFNAGMYDDTGVTNLSDECGDKSYAVFINMHY